MDIMKAILEIEQKAHGIKESADELKKQQNDALKAELAAKENEFKKKLEDRRNGLARESFALRNEKMEALEKVYTEKLEILEKRCSDNMDKWVEQIVDAVINA